MNEFDDQKATCLAHAEVHGQRAERFAALNVTAVIVTALLAAMAAVTSLTSVPTWMTTTSAALSAALGIVTASFKLQDKSATHTELAADLERLASRYAQLAELEGPIPPGNWSLELEQIQNLLAKNKPVPDEDKWAAARLPASTTV